MQVCSLTPSVGSRGYEKTFENGFVIDRVGGYPLEHWQIDGNHVVATSSPSPWLVQLRLLAAYAAFYNPLHLLEGLVRPRQRLFLADVGIQVVGMYALARTAVKYLRWSGRMWWGPVTRQTAPPASSWRLVDPAELDRPGRETRRPDAAPAVKATLD